MTDSRARGFLFAGFGLFLVVIAFLLVPSFVRTEVPVYLPTPVGERRADDAAGLVSDTVTVDAGAEGRWQFFDLDRGAVIEPPDTSGWDLAFQRFHVIPSGGMVNLGKVPFDTVAGAPESGYVASEFGRDTLNTATARWYSYSYFSHLLSPLGEVYALRTRDGRYAKLEILSYYCPGPTPGCLTFRYAFNAAGGRALRR